jgi:phospholipase C
MTRKQIWKATSASLGVAAMMINSAAFAGPAITTATSTTTIGAQYGSVLPAKTTLTAAAKLALIQAKIKYVFVIFQENRSFDGYFGTYPGANGLFSSYPGAKASDPTEAAANANPTAGSFAIPIRNVDGTYTTMTPFLSPRSIVDVNGKTVPLYPESSYSVDHSHTGYIADLHFQDANLTAAATDGYALDQEGLQFPTASSNTSTIVKGSNATYPVVGGVAPTSNPTLAAKQKAEVAISHRDCDTVPFLWHYADVGTLFDNLHQTIIGPSTPNAIAMISAQSGATQWAKHPTTTGKYTTAYTVPNETDAAPFAGSAGDTYANKPPYGPDEASFATCATASTVVTGTYNNTACTAPQANDPALASYTTDALVSLDGALSAYASPQLTLTYASLPLSFMGPDISAITAKDVYPVLDLSDVKNDITAIAKNDKNVIPWGWYQQGFGIEPFDNTRVVDGFPANTPHPSYIVHHNGPQYFGYLGDNPVELTHMHSLAQFFTDVGNLALGNKGVFYIRGGYYNNDSLVPADPSPAAQAEFNGNDDHGSYSDSQISESMVADAVNAIANSAYWPNSAIIISYDESDGFYDHAPVAIRNWGPDGLPMSGGPRIPTIVLSPYSTSHAVSHVYDEHGSIVSFINKLFGMRALSSLPEESAAEKAAATNTLLNGPNGQAQTALGPNDGNAVGDLLEAFDNDRLSGKAALLPASAVIIPASTVASLPHYNGNGCTTLKIVPTDYPNGYGAGMEIDPPPADWNPRPTVAPGVPYYGVTYVGGSYYSSAPSGSTLTVPSTLFGTSSITSAGPYPGTSTGAVDGWVP